MGNFTDKLIGIYWKTLLAIPWSSYIDRDAENEKDK
jgi:hypothetical protein